jgi:hypothetical protein
MDKAKIFPVKLSQDKQRMLSANNRTLADLRFSETQLNYGELARLIVRAVNAHDKLVEACKSALEVGEIKFGSNALSRDVACRIMAAIDAAEKE